jgi:hypothetical protein
MTVSTAAREYLNRAILCLFAVCLLWLTSLQVAVEIVNIFFMAPPFGDVYSECDNSANTVNDYRISYHSCVAGQLETCGVGYSGSYHDEYDAMVSGQIRNANYISSMKGLVDNSTAALDELRSALKSWSEQDVMNIIPYASSTPSSTCSPEVLVRAKKFTDDTTVSTQSSFYHNFNEYISNENAVMQSLTEYGVAFSEYNAQYIANKTGNLRFLSVDFVDEIALPRIDELNVTIANIELSLSQLMSCVSLVNESYDFNHAGSVSCPLGVNMNEFYEEWANFIHQEHVMMNGTLKQWQATFTYYQAQVAHAISNANSFYQAVAGAQGLVAYLENKLSSVGVELNMCAIGTWCQYPQVTIFNSLMSLI